MATTITKTVKSSGGDYTSLNAWAASIAGRGADLTTRDVVERAECFGFTDTTAVSISGITTDTTRRVEISTPDTARHGGKWNSSAYILATTNAPPFSATIGHLVLDGLQFSSAPTYSSGTRYVSYAQTSTATAPYCYFINCIYGESNANNIGPAFQNAYTSSGNTATIVAKCCLVHSSAGVAHAFKNTNVLRCNFYAYNCTACISGVEIGRASCRERV